MTRYEVKWKNLFQPQILERGLDYYNRGLVEDFNQGDDFIAATVEGNSAYDVVIDLEDGEILAMNCECPYAEEGDYCKHMAAVLFCMEGAHTNRIDRNINAKMESKEENDVRKLVKEADAELIEAFLIDVLKNDLKMLTRFKSSVCRGFSKEDMKRFKKQIDQVVWKNTDRNGFVDYRSASTLTCELMDFLDQDIANILSSQRYKEAFELSCYIFTKAGDLEIDDSDGGVSEIAQTCVQIWHDILEQCDVNLKRNMFQWCMKHVGGDIADYMEEFILQTLFENFSENEFLDAKLKFTDRKMDEIKKEKDSWTRNYNAGKWAIYHIDVMKKQRASQDEMDDFCRKNLHLSQVREYYVQDCMDQQKYDIAIRILEDGKNTVKDAPGFVSSYSLQLKNLYKLTGDKQAYEKELWLLVLYYRDGNLDLYRELKALYEPAEWEERRETIFEKLKKHDRIDQLYAEEKLYDRLFDVVRNTAGLYKLNAYEKVLKNLYPTEILEKYEKEVKEFARSTTDRKRYREIVGILKTMKKYAGGVETVNSIVKEWRIMYRNRRAMMEELNSL